MNSASDILINQLKRENAELSKFKGKCDHITQKLSTLESTIEILRSNNKQLEQEKADIQSINITKISNLKAEIQQLTLEKIQNEKAIEAYMTELSYYESNFLKIKEANDSNNLLIDRYKSKVSKYKHKAKDYEKELINKSKLDNILKPPCNCKTEKYNNYDTINKISEKDKIIYDLTEKINELKNEMIDIKSEYKIVKSELKNYKENNKLLESKLLDSDNLIITLKAENSKILKNCETYLNNIQLNEKEINNYKSKINNLNAEIKELSKSNAHLNNKIKKYVLEKEELENQKFKNNVEIDNIAKDNLIKSDIIDNFIIKNKEINAEFEFFDSINNAVKDEINTYSRAIEDSSDVFLTINDKIKYLNKILT